MSKKWFLFLFVIFFNIIKLYSAEIEGILLGADSKPMITANVRVSPLIYYDTLSLTYNCDKNGHFKFQTNDTGFIYLLFSGVNHQPFEVPLYIKDTNINLKIECQLRANCLDTNKKISIFGNFNGYQLRTIDPDTNLIMKRNRSGLYTINIHYPKDTLIYQIYNEGMQSYMNGTAVDFYLLEPSGRYQSVIVSSDSIKQIILDPKYFDLSCDTKLSPKIKILNDSVMHDFVNFFVQLKAGENLMAAEQDSNDIAKKNDNAFKITDLFTNKVGKLITKRLNELDTLISNTNEYPKKIILYMEYLDLASISKAFNDVAKIWFIKLFSIDINVETVKRGLKEIPPISPLWMKSSGGQTMEPQLWPSVVFLCTVIADGHDSSSYFEELITSYPVAEFRKGALIQAVNYYDESGFNDNRKKYFLSRLFTDFPNDRDVRAMKQEYTKESKLRVGMKAPKFKLIDLDNSEHVITEKDLIGKYTLMDFWATNCGPCIEEFDFITDAYNKFKDSNFQIISISFDLNKDKVVLFRSKRYKMPWINTVETKSFMSDIAKDYEINAIPYPFLIGPDGRILEIDNTLRGGKLIPTLQKYLK